MDDSRTTIRGQRSGDTVRVESVPSFAKIDQVILLLLLGLLLLLL